jgi:hypothetical protein
MTAAEPSHLLDASHELAYLPADLLQGTESPAQEHALSASPLTAAGIMMPSAEQLQPQLADVSAAQHNEVVGKVLVDALEGGQDGSIDSVLASLPNAAGDGAPHMLAADALAAVAEVHLPSLQVVSGLEVFAVHYDAAPHA